MVYPTGFKINGVDFNDIYVRSEYFTEGGLWTWGRNDYGQIGDNSIIHRSSPVQTVASGTNWKQVASGFTTAAIKTDGTLWTWGRNDYGQIGDNSIIHRSSPVQTAAGGTNWKQVVGGVYHTAAIKTDGTLWTWGWSIFGQLGQDNTTDRSSPIQTTASGTNWKQVAGGAYHTAAIKTDGTLWAWGFNGDGELGVGDTTDRSSPIQTTASGTNWKQVASGSFHTAAIKTDGTLWTWGHNQYGQLGDNSSLNHKSSPIQTTAGGTNWKQVAGGSYHTAAIKTDGTLWTWGHNQYGQLGDNSGTNNKSSPVQTAAGGTNWKQVAGGSFNTAAIKTNGTLWIWGHNLYGAIGNNTSNNNSSSPVQTVTGGTNWKQVALGENITLSIRDQW